MASTPSGTASPEAEFPTPVIPHPTANDRHFFPPAPRSLEEAGVTEDEVQRLIIKLLASRGALQGRRIAQHVRLPFSVIEHLFLEIRREHLIALKGDAIAGDYTYVITEKGLSRGQELARDCTYYGAAPVPLDQYVAAMKQQSITRCSVRDADLRAAFRDLLMDDSLLQVLGPAINSGRGLFLFGEPGNGKTSIAERVSASFGTTIWIPRCLGIDGEIIRVYDPAIHHICRFDTPGQPPVDEARVDHRWVRVHRPTVIAGGELTMAELEVTRDPNSRICEAPLQLKSNGGVLLIDDFGRQRMPIDELLNRWIVPLEKRYDLLNLPSGKKVRVPFDQLVIFSTNLEPRDLVDDAFLRRIPYKVQVPNPSARQFHRLFALACDQHGVDYNEDAVDYLIDQHFTQTGRALRACYPRDLLMQIRNHCIYEETPFVLSREAMDFAVRCYFSVLS